MQFSKLITISWARLEVYLDTNVCKCLVWNDMGLSSPTSFLHGERSAHYFSQKDVFNIEYVIITNSCVWVVNAFATLELSISLKSLNTFIHIGKIEHFKFYGWLNWKKVSSKRWSSKKESELSIERKKNWKNLEMWPSQLNCQEYSLFFFII